MPQIHCKIHGRVQGVCFRAATAMEAERLHLSGWVRNCDDGGVECLAEGPRAALDELLCWLQHGPPAARVDQVDSHWQEGPTQYQHFSIV